MKLLEIWKVPAEKTQVFMQNLSNKGVRRDSPATLMNFLAGFNYFYLTDESYGDITEETALRLSENHKVNIKVFGA